MRAIIPTFGAPGHLHPLVPFARALESAGRQARAGIVIQPDNRSPESIRDGGSRRIE